MIHKNNFKNYNADLLKNKDRLELVKENIGITDETIKECSIGYDKENDINILIDYKNNEAIIKLTDNLNINDGIRILSDSDIGFIVTKMYKDLKSIKSAIKSDIIRIKTPKVKIKSDVLKVIPLGANSLLIDISNHRPTFIFYTTI